MTISQISPDIAPFAVALALFFGILLLELISALFGGTLMGLGADADGPDFDLGDGPDFDVGALEVDAADLAEYDFGADAAPDTTAPPALGAAAWLGLGQAPMVLWLASALAAFGLSGIVLQQLAQNLIGGALPIIMAFGAAGAAGLWFAKAFASRFARLLPKNETTAISQRSMGGRRGMVSQGTARRGSPAEVRVTDGFGNTHYLRAEPLEDDVSIPAGTEVAVIKNRRTGAYRLLALS